MGAARGKDGSRAYDGDVLHDAVFTNDLAAVQRLLAAGADPNERLGGGTSLIASVQEPPEFYRADEEAITDALLEAGADVHAVDDDGWSALHHSVRAGARAVSRIITAGADPNLAAKDGTTLLHAAVEFSEPDAVRLPLDADARPDARDALGQRPLDLARAIAASPPAGGELLVIALLERAAETPRRRLTPARRPD